MSCNQNCKDCIYGIPVAKAKCGNQNCSCDGMCYKCIFRQETIVKYICTDRVKKGVSI